MSFEAEKSPYRSFVALLVGVVMTAGFAVFLDKVSPAARWLFVPLVKIYAWEALLSVACVSFGHAVIARVLRLRDLTEIQRLAFAFPIGLLGFALGMYLGGYLALYGPAFAVALPLALLAVGLFYGRVPWRRWAVRPRAVSGLALFSWSYGLLCLGLLYIQLLSPDTLNYDSTWTHLVIAQDYAREGRIFPIMGNWAQNVPNLASVVNTWGFLVPGLGNVPPLRWMMALHTEFTVFLWTLVGVAAGVERLVDRRVRGAWPAFFLFPSIFVYDGNLAGSSDHFVALFAVPMFLAALRAARRFEPTESALLGVFFAGALMAKMQGAYVIAATAAYLGVRWCLLLAARLRGRNDAPDLATLLRAPAIVGGVFALVACPHFLENWFYFNNPFYPLMQDKFARSTPTMPNAADFADTLLSDWHHRPPKIMSERFVQALRLVFLFSFEPHYSFLGTLPTFGSLFTLLVPFVPVLPRARKIWIGALIGSGAIFLWAFTYWVDRNLQTFLPLLVTVTAAVIVKVWDLGALARAGLVPLLGLQLVWGADLMFTGSDRVQAGVALIRGTLDGHGADRFAQFRRPFRDLGSAIPKDGLAVLHNYHVSLGIDRRLLLDWTGFQGIIDYRTFRTPREAFDRFQALGVTHFVYPHDGRSAASMQEEIVFDALMALHAPHVGDYGPFALHAMPKTPPPAEAPYKVLLLAIDRYGDGVFPIANLGANVHYPHERQSWPPPDEAVTSDRAAAALGSVEAAVIGGSVRLDDAASAKLRGDFRNVASYGSFTVYARPPRAR